MRAIKLYLLTLGFLTALTFIPIANVSAISEIENETTNRIKTVEQIEVHKKEFEAKKAQLKKEVEAKKQAARQQAEALLEQKRAEIKQRTEGQRQKSCEKVSASLSKKLQKGTEKASQHKALLDKHLAKIKEFKERKNLKVDNYEGLATNAANASSQAQASIDALKTFSPNVDCSKIGQTTNNVASYKETIITVREDLKAYRKSIKDLLIAVKTTLEVNTIGSDGQN